MPYTKDLYKKDAHGRYVLTAGERQEKIAERIAEELETGAQKVREVCKDEL